MDNKTNLPPTNVKVAKSGLITIGHGTDPRQQKTLPCLNEQSYRMFWSDRRVLVEATGFELQHCVFLGLRYCRNFLRRVAAYRIVSRKKKTVRCRVITSDRSETSFRRKTETLRIIFYKNRPWERRSQ
ncbi:MAG: hypothetical protein AAB731_05440 [Patescibacteria group bacterium]